ncbi:MmyB family transcriptional regulator [Streptomyces chartreusis]
MFGISGSSHHAAAPRTAAARGVLCSNSERLRPELIGELSLHSDTFRRIWAEHDVQAQATGTKRLRHPLVSDLTLDYLVLAVEGDPEQTLTIYTPEPASPSAEALALLASWTRTPPPGRTHPKSPTTRLADARALRDVPGVAGAGASARSAQRAARSTASYSRRSAAVRASATRARPAPRHRQQHPVRAAIFPRTPAAPPIGLLAEPDQSERSVPATSYRRRLHRMR